MQKAAENGRVVKTKEEKAIEGIEKKSEPNSGNILVLKLFIVYSI